MCVSKNITEGNIYKSLILYAIPLILSSLLNNIYSTVDALIAGKFIGEYSLGAISATGSFETLFRSLFIGFAGGLSIYVAHLFGKGDFSNLKRRYKRCRICFCAEHNYQCFCDSLQKSYNGLSKG